VTGSGYARPRQPRQPLLALAQRHWPVVDAVALAIVSPSAVIRTVGPLRRPNAELRTREHLLPAEVEGLMDACKANRQGHRDAPAVPIADRKTRSLWVRRARWK
jgi:hypothetical protein